MTTDFRALCARMADALDHYRQLLMDDRRETHALAAEARAELAQPEPEGPSDEELLRLADFLDSGNDVEAVVAFGRAAYNLALAQPEPKGGGSIHGLEGEIVATIRAYASVEPQVGASRILHESDFGVVARAILARWGRPAIEPVPVAERPWEREGWCDEAGWCWVFDADDTDPCWVFHRPEAWSCWTHSLPHNALPLPTPLEMNP
jgi:hypothetical protein